MLFYSLDKNYFIVIVLSLALLIYFLYLIFDTYIKSQKTIKKLKLFLQENNIPYTMNKSTIPGATISLTVHNVTYPIKFVHTKRYCEIQINNKDTWEMDYRSAAGLHKHKFVIGLTTFMFQNASNRVIILLEKANKIKRAVNESDLALVKKEQEIYGVHILNSSEDFTYFSEKKA